MRDELVELTRSLVSIDSVNPDLVPGGAGEGAISEFVAGWLERAGLQVEREEVRAGRWNVVATARGSGGGRSLMLNAHTDTVGTGGMKSPFHPRLEEGRLYGRGAYDMKASLAAIMLAGAAAARESLRGDVLVTAVADEEVGSVGTAAVAASRTAHAAIVAEPTEERVAVAHRGFVWVEVESHGRAAHGSRPDLGVDAIVKMGGVLTGLGDLDRMLRARPTHPLLGSGSVHASLIEGGTELSTYPDRCLLGLERRTVPGETPPAVEREVREIVQRAGAGEGSPAADVRVTFAREPFEVDAGADVVAAVSRAAAAGDGGEPDRVGVPFWTDAAVLADAGIPTVLFGPAGEGAHADVEWVDVHSAARCAEVYLAVARELCA
ncbi:MAG: ArgE/DapE family deacylase [Thermoleophilia bacterium]|nr:ArgE/DapE family deacylase [Thermoleophilia bacterium]